MLDPVGPRSFLSREPYHALGVDVGATLAKLAFRRRGDVPTEFQLLPAHDLSTLSQVIRAADPGRLVLTGAGAAKLADHLSLEAARVNEFTAWGAGVAELLAASGRAPEERTLIVSVGTGTSMMLAVRQADGPPAVTHLGGSTLGGGSIQGLGRVLAGSADFDALCRLAVQGSRASVDLSVADIYGPDAPLPGDVTAAAFAKLARAESPPPPADQVQALLWLVGQTVGLQSAALALAMNAQTVVCGGTALRGNDVTRAGLQRMLEAYGRTARFPEDGEYAGALGALVLGAGEAA